MVRFILENFLKAIFMGMDRWVLQMVIRIWDSGWMDKCKELVISYGNQIMRNILGNMQEIKKMGLELINLLMEGNILVIFEVDSLMVKQYYKKRIIWIKSHFGQMEIKWSNKLYILVKKIFDHSFKWLFYLMYEIIFVVIIIIN